MEPVAANQNRKQEAPIIILDLRFDFSNGKIEVTEVDHDE